MQTDRNLLLGVLAFQDDYIDLAQFAAICREWAADKSRSISQLLVERQWLSESDRDELERKVERKLMRFVGDAHATLGAVSDSVVLDVLKQVDDPDIHAAIPELADEIPEPAQTVDPASQQSDKSEPRYTRGKLQGEGTFGIVWLAYDKQLDREVALKELKTSKSRNPDLWKRFLREAQVTGKLQHPNIVPVYELDPRAGGEQPFYTMKPVKGRTLRKAIDAFHQEHKGRPSETLELNRLLQSFVQVCEALAYAHSRDVVHRDLKPENIVLGDFGEVIVLDWGEAKLLGSPEPPPDETAETVQESDAPLVSSSPALRISGDAAETPGTKLGTAKGSPGYMSPEQVRGDVHLMEPRTDVYGLGAILFDILIGHPPHQPTPEMKAKQQRLTIEDWRSIILANPTPRAREHNATIPVALDAICAKAMSAELSSRYSSANDLAQDIQRFLADEPVSVCQDPVVVRARRWMKRHQVVAATTAAVLMVSIVSLTALSIVVTGKNADLKQANQAERRAKREAEDNAVVATEQSQLALDTMTKVIKDLQRSLENMPRGAEVRKQMLSTVLPQLDKIATQFASKPAVDHNTMTALSDLGDTILELGYSRDSDSELLSNATLPNDALPRILSGKGSRRDSSAARMVERLYRRAHEIATTLANASPKDHEAQCDLAYSYHCLGDVFQILGRTADALQQFEAAAKISQVLTKDHPHDVKTQRRVAASHSRLGDVFLTLGRTNDALPHFEKSSNAFLAITEIDPTEHKHQRDLTKLYGRIGTVYLALGRTSDALWQFEEYSKRCRKLADADSANATMRLLLANSIGTLGSAYQMLGRTNDALRSFEEATNLCRSLTIADANSSWIPFQLAGLLMGLGDVHVTLGRTQDALQDFEESSRLLRALADGRYCQMLWMRRWIRRRLG